MDCNIPVFQKCCFFFPLRPGLLVYGYVKLVVAFIIEVLYTHMLVTKYAKSYLIGLMIAVIVIDSAATIVFLVGCHKKNLTCITWYFTYSIYLLSFKTFGLFVLSFFHPIPWQIIPNILLHIYLLLLIRSVRIHLKNQNEAPCEFENKLSNPKCTIKVEEHANIENGIECKEHSNVEELPDNGVRNTVHMQNEIEHTDITPKPASTGKNPFEET